MLGVGRAEAAKAANAAATSVATEVVSGWGRGDAAPVLAIFWSSNWETSRADLWKALSASEEDEAAAVAAAAAAATEPLGVSGLV